ncbi:MAG TPA: formylglycine-generating enzyme family protein [Chthoniobacteraceae bacterium]|jgi:formylglycine-generating enzyme required for sulfatase activity
MISEPQPDLVSLPAGEFVMGSTIGDKFSLATERPAHRVTLSEPFALGRFPVTVREYREFAEDHDPTDNPALPVVNVSWSDAQNYCAWLSRRIGRSYRLPTEAEWEYACGAGSTTPFSTGDDITTDDATFLYSEQGERVGQGARTPPGSHPPNAFGLGDMHGNVCEWMQDDWHPDYVGAPLDGRAWSDGEENSRRVIRGGAWDYLPRLLRTVWRDSLPKDERRDNVGFRIANTLDF